MTPNIVYCVCKAQKNELRIGDQMLTDGIYESKEHALQRAGKEESIMCDVWIEEHDVSKTGYADLKDKSTLITTFDQ